MAPDVAIVGEVRDREALPLLLTLSSGVKGFTTIHAANARGALSRIRFLAELSESARNLPHSALTTLVGDAVDLVVFSQRGPDGPRVTEIVAVEDLAGSPDVGCLHRHRPVHPHRTDQRSCAGPATFPTDSPERSPPPDRTCSRPSTTAPSTTDGRDRNGAPSMMGVVAASAAAYGTLLLYTAVVLAVGRHRPRSGAGAPDHTAPYPARPTGWPRPASAPSRSASSPR